MDMEHTTPNDQNQQTIGGPSNLNGGQFVPNEATLPSQHHNLYSPQANPSGITKNPRPRLPSLGGTHPSVHNVLPQSPLQNLFAADEFTDGFFQLPSHLPATPLFGFGPNNNYNLMTPGSPVKLAPETLGRAQYTTGSSPAMLSPVLNNTGESRDDRQLQTWVNHQLSDQFLKYLLIRAARNHPDVMESIKDAVEMQSATPHGGPDNKTQPDLNHSSPMSPGPNLN